MLPFIVASIAVLGLIWLYKSIERRIMRPPKTYPNQDVIIPNKKILVCAGDSITHGNMSHDWVEDLRTELSDYQIFNAGVNSDLSFTLLNRLEDIIAVKPHNINILIGTNDIIAQSQTLKKSDRYIKYNKIPWGTQPSLHSYEVNLMKIINRLKAETSASISLMSIPIIGEDIDHSIIKTVEKYNDCVKNIANTEGVTYLSLFENQKQFLQNNNAQSHIPFEKTAAAIVSAAQLHVLLGRSLDAITEKRGHLLTFDNLHFNSKGASFMKTLLSNHLKSIA